VVKSIFIAFQSKKNMKKYTCPMHLQVIKDEPGKCPLCGMDLVPMGGSKKETHSHHGHHQHHDHKEHSHHSENHSHHSDSGYENTKDIIPTISSNVFG